MKNLLLLFAIILSVNSFAQEPEDDIEFDSVTPYYFLDSIYIKYKVTNGKFGRDIYYDEETIATLLNDSTEIRITSDEDLSMLLTDSIARLYHSKQEFSYKKQIRAIYNFIDNTAIDSNLHVLYVRVISPCQPCMNSLIEYIQSEDEVIKLISKGKLKYIYVNYYQTIRNSRYEFVVITAKHWFRRRETYTLYNEKL
jgi:hypothetical protein